MARTKDMKGVIVLKNGAMKRSVTDILQSPAAKEMLRQMRELSTPDEASPARQASSQAQVPGFQWHSG